MGSRARISVLLVEDNLDHCDLCREYLPAEEFDLVVAHSGAECLANIKKRPFQVVLLDYLLPDTNGLDLMPRVHEFQPNARVLLVSVVADPDLSYRALRSGATDYIVKSYGYFKELKDIIWECLED
ncbi:MAG: response regulator [Methanomassiliicoccales archaeon]|nr:response regulator [Methanomassiliicoccales archaeon]